MKKLDKNKTIVSDTTTVKWIINEKDSTPKYIYNGNKREIHLT